MIPLYASQLRVEAGPDPVATADAVFSRIEQWAAGELGRPVSLPVAGGTIHPAPGVRIELRLDADKGGWTLVFRRDEPFGPVESKVRLRVGEKGLDLAHLEASERDPSSWRQVRTPAFLRRILKDLPCRSVVGFDLPAGPTTLQAAAVEDFVEGLLLLPARTMPLVMISQDDYLGAPLVDPEAVADRLAGLARVFVLEDKSASFALTRAVGDKTRGCYLGAVRLYLPGFSLEGDPFEHLLIQANRLRSASRETFAADLILAEAMGRFPGWLPPGGPIASLVAETTIRTRRFATPPPKPRDEAPAATVVRPAAALRSVPPPPAPERPPTALGLLPRLKELMDENRVLFARNDELEKQIVDAETDRDLHAEAIRHLEARLSAAEDKELELEMRLAEAQNEAGDLRFVVDKLRREHPELFEEPPRTVLEAVSRIAALEDPAIVLLPSAYASAEDSPYLYPEKVLSALQALAEFARRRRRAAETGEAIGSPVQLFESRGLRYSSRNSVTSKGRWAEEYRVTYEGRKVVLDEHLSLGSSHDPAACLRIYFFWDGDERVTVIAHVGRHKKNTLT